MPGAFTIVCPHCQARLKLKAEPPPGKKLKCPKCSRHFSQAQGDADNESWFNELSDAAAVAEDGAAELPPARRQSRSRRPVKPSRRQFHWRAPALIGAVVVVVVGLVIVGGLATRSWFAGGVRQIVSAPDNESERSPAAQPSSPGAEIAIVEQASPDAPHGPVGEQPAEQPAATPAADSLPPPPAAQPVVPAASNEYLSDDGKVALAFPAPPKVHETRNSLMYKNSFAARELDSPETGARYFYAAMQAGRDYYALQLPAVFAERSRELIPAPIFDQTDVQRRIVCGRPAVRYSYRFADYQFTVVEVYSEKVIHRLMASQRPEKFADSKHEMDTFFNSLEFRNPEYSAELARVPVPVDARQLLDEAAQSEEWKKLEGKYDDRPVEFTGIVKSFKVMDSILDYPVKVSTVELKGTTAAAKKSLLDFGVMCCFEDVEPWKFCRSGNKVTIRGRVPHLGASILSPAPFANCEFVSHENSPIPEITSRELAREFAANPDAFTSKYDGETAIVRGKVVKRHQQSAKDDPLGLGNAWNLETQSGVIIGVVNSNLFDAKWKELQVGDTVEILATVRVFLKGSLGKSLLITGDLMTAERGGKIKAK